MLSGIRRPFQPGRLNHLLVQQEVSRHGSGTHFLSTVSGHVMVVQVNDRLCCISYVVSRWFRPLSHDHKNGSWFSKDGHSQHISYMSNVGVSALLSNGLSRCLHWRFWTFDQLHGSWTQPKRRSNSQGGDIFHSAYVAKSALHVLDKIRGNFY